MVKSQRSLWGLGADLHEIRNAGGRGHLKAAQLLDSVQEALLQLWRPSQVLPPSHHRVRMTVRP